MSESVVEAVLVSHPQIPGPIRNDDGISGRGQYDDVAQASEEVTTGPEEGSGEVRDYDR